MSNPNFIHIKVKITLPPGKVKMRLLSHFLIKVKMRKNEEKKEENKSTPGKVLFPKNPPKLSQLFHFHKDLEKLSWMGNSLHFFNMFKKLEMNIPFVEVLAQEPNYVKFMKEIMSNKKKLDAYGTVTLSENCSEII